MTDSSGLYNLSYNNSTDGQIEVYNLKWSFPNFIKLLENKTAREYRTLREEIDSKFQLKMLLVGRNKDLIEIFYLSPTSIFLKSVLCVIHKRWDERSINTIEYRTIPANKWQYLATLYKRDMDTYEGREAFLLNDGSLKLSLKLLICQDVKEDRHNIPAARLSDDFRKLLIDGSYSDAIMKSIEGDEFRVHKPVLAIRSEVLKAHFEHETKESITNSIETQLESDVLHEILNFIYTDKAPRIDEIPDKLLAAADYYQLSRLKSLCEEALHNRLTVENAIETLSLAEIHSANSLKQSTLEFIKDGQAMLITNTQGWKNVQSIELVKKIYEFIMSNETAYIC